MNTLKKDLMLCLFGCHLNNKVRYLQFLDEEVVNLFPYTPTDLDLIDYIKHTSYHDILIITHNNKKDYTKAIKQLVIRCRLKIATHKQEHINE